MKRIFRKLKTWFPYALAWLLLMKRAILSAWSIIQHKNTLSGPGFLGFLMRREISQRLALPIYHLIAFETGFCPTDEEFEARLQLNPLYDYAARNWGHHARAASTEVEQLILDFLESEAKVSASSQAMMASRKLFWLQSKSAKANDRSTPCGILRTEETMIALLRNGHDPDFKDTYGRTPLSWAAENGHEAVVKLLLEKEGVEPDSKDNEYGQTPLSWAAENGHEAVVKLLLEKDGVDPDSKD